MPFLWKNNVGINMVSSVLDIAPSNVLWGNVATYVSRKPSDERARMTFLSIEASLRHHGVPKAPSVLEETVFLDAKSADSAKAVLTDLRDRLSQTVLPDGVIVFIDLADPRERLLCEDVIGAISSKPQSFPLIGDMVDDLHDVIIGPRPLCEGLAADIGTQAAVHAIEGNVLVWLEIPPSVLKLKTALYPRISRWLIPK
jgi:hypothetical protein